MSYYDEIIESSYMTFVIKSTDSSLFLLLRNHCYYQLSICL